MAASRLASDGLRRRHSNTLHVFGVVLRDRGFLRTVMSPYDYYVFETSTVEGLLIDRHASFASVWETATIGTKGLGVWIP